MFMKLPKRITTIIKISLALVAVLAVLSVFALRQYLEGQRLEQFALETAREIKNRICPKGYSPVNPCGQKDVREKADSGLIVSLYIYGTTDPEQINALYEVIKARRSSESFYRKIPVKVVFYTDLQKSSVAAQFWILGE